MGFHLGDSFQDSLGRQFKVMAEQLGGFQLQLGPQQEVVLEIKVHNDLKELKPEFLRWRQMRLKSIQILLQV